MLTISRCEQLIVGYRLAWDWYHHAQLVLGRHPQGYRISCLLALFSPRVSVTRSVNFTKYYMTTGMFRRDVTRSVRAAVDHWESTGEIRGPKTSSFQRALMGDTEAVVLDIHMANLFGVEQRVFSTRSGYRYYSDCVVRLGWLYGHTPRDMQALLWCGYVNSIGRTVPRLDLSFLDEELF